MHHHFNVGTLKNSVIFQLRVQAYDTAFPNMRASEDVVIFVNLNPSTPVFAEGEYRITIPETYPINSMLLTVNASDADGVRIWTTSLFYAVMMMSL